MGVVGDTRNQLDLPGVAGRQGKAQILTTKGGPQAYPAGATGLAVAGVISLGEICISV